MNNIHMNFSGYKRSLTYIEVLVGKEIQTHASEERSLRIILNCCAGSNRQKLRGGKVGCHHLDLLCRPCVASVFL